MTVKRLTTEKERQILRDSKKYKGKASSSELTRQELDDLIIILAKKAGII